MRKKKTNIKNYLIFLLIIGAGAYSYFHSAEVYSCYMRTYYEKIRGKSIEEQIAEAEQLHENRQYRELKDYCHTRIMVYPDTMEFRKLDGLARIRLGEPLKGIDRVLSASGSERMSPKLLEETVGQLSEQRRYRDIIEIFKKNDPGGNPGLLYQYGVAIFETGNPAGAVPYLKKGIEEGRSGYEAYHYLGRAFARTGKYREALPCLERAHDLNDDDPDVARSLANCYRALHRYDDSARILRTIKQ
jgi:tetratricopeptide (TPR) repeat protein